MGDPFKVRVQGLCPENKEGVKSTSHPAEEKARLPVLNLTLGWEKGKKKNLPWEFVITSWTSHAFQFGFMLLVWLKQTQLENLKWSLLGRTPSQLAEANPVPPSKNWITCQPYRMSTNTVPKKRRSSHWKIIINSTRRKRELAGMRDDRNTPLKSLDLRWSYADWNNSNNYCCVSKEIEERFESKSREWDCHGQVWNRTQENWWEMLRLVIWNSVDRLNSELDTAKERISKPIEPQELSGRTEWEGLWYIYSDL